MFRVGKVRTMNRNERDPVSEGEPQTARSVERHVSGKKYSRPELRPLGTVAELTLAGGATTIDNGVTNTRRTGG